MATTTSWLGVSTSNNSGDWLTSADWTGGVPNASLAAVIDTPNGGTVTYDPSGGSNNVFSLSVQTANTTLDIVTGTLDILHAGNQDISGTVINSGVFEVSGGSQIVGASITNNGLIQVVGSATSSANLEVADFNAQANGTISVGLNATVRFDTSMPATQTIKLTDGSAQLLVAASTSMSAPIMGFGSSNIIDYFTTQYLSTDKISYSGNATQGIVTISDANGSLVANASFKGNYTANSFGLEPDPANRLELYYACFVTGTRITTSQGECAVESLAVGDRVQLARGGEAPVVWIGQRRVACRLHPDPSSVWPIRIAAHAFALGQPRRDLLLSPDHAVFVDGMLVPIRALVNGTSITMEPVAQVKYWHVELAEHDVILADGLPVESYLDRGNRHSFANGGPVTMLHPDFAGVTHQANACAVLTIHGLELDRIRRDIASRAGEGGQTRQPKSQGWNA